MPSDATHASRTHSVTRSGAHSRTHWVADRLDVRLAQGRVDRAQLAGLAEALCALHASPAGGAPAAAPASAPAPLAERGAAACALLSERAPELAGLAAERAAALAAAIEAAGPALAERAATCAARRLHGRLCCEAIHVDPDGRAALGAPAQDATGDPCEDLAALAVTLGARGRCDLARQLVGAYAEAAGDFGLYRVLDAHLAHAALAAAQRVLADAPEGEAARAAAERLLAAPAALAAPGAPPFVIAVAGVMASGKSTLAARLAEAHAAPVVSADAARPAGAEGLAPEAGDAAYAEMFRRAGEVLGSGRPVVLDACFATRAQREALRSFAARHGAPLLLVECRADAALTRRRLAERARRQGRPASEWLALRERLLATWEPIRELPREQHLPVDTARDVELCLPRIERALARRAVRPHRVRHAQPRGMSALA
jgi:predicted kinase